MDKEVYYLKSATIKILKKKIEYFLLNKKSCIKKLNFAKKRLNRFDYNYNLNKYYKTIKNYIN